MAEIVLSVFVEAVVSNLVPEVIQQAVKFKDKAKSVYHYKDDIQKFSVYLKRLQDDLKYAMPDCERFEVSCYAQNDQNKVMVKALYKIAQDAEDVIQDCQYERNRWHRMLLPFTASKRIKDIQRRIEALNEMRSNGGRIHVIQTEGEAAADGVREAASEFRQNILRLTSIRRYSLKRRSLPVEVSRPVGIEDQIIKLQCLLIKDQQTYILGIHGMRGSGKSLLMKCVWNSEEVQKSFENDLLIWVPVSNGPLAWLQGNIARQIKMKLNDGWNEEEAKTQIFRHLESKRFLMVLDGVCANEATEFLCNLGIPPDNVNGSKIVVISSYKDDLFKIRPDMPLINVQQLSEEDSWKLFESYAFGKDTSSLLSEVLQPARSIASKCYGHPLALKAYGAAMAGKREPWQWQLAAREATEQDTSFFGIATDAEIRVLQRLRPSYESLSPKLRLAFLYLAAFPENHQVRTADLIDLWSAERLIQAQTDSALEANGRRLLNILIDRCVVEGVEAGSLGRVRKCRMHPLFRLLATHTLEREEDEEEKSLFRAGDNITEFPSMEISQHRRISLMYNHISSLPEEFICSALRTLILRHSSRLSSIPPRFLKGLSRLRTLDLSMTGIESLPVTVGRLKRLENLNLSRTKLKSLPEAITRLYRLKKLNLFECKELERLPVDMGKLKDLLYLNLRRCTKMRFLPHQVTRIASLQCLIMDGCDNLEWNGLEKHSRLEDLKSLINLRYLSFVCAQTGIPDGLMDHFASMERLEVCRVPSKILPENIQQMKMLQDLRLSRLEHLMQLPGWLCNLSSLTRITLEYLKVRSIPPGILEKLPILHLLEIEHCDELTELPSEFGKEGAFPDLEELRLDHLDALKELPALEEGTMKMLKELRVRFCKGITKFPVGVEGLKKITRIDIVGSGGLIDSVGENGADRKRMIRLLDTLNC